MGACALHVHSSGARGHPRPGARGPPEGKAYRRATVGRKGPGLGVRAWFCRGLWTPLGVLGVPGLHQLRLKFVPQMFPDLHVSQLVSWVLKIKYKVRPLRIKESPLKSLKLFMNTETHFERHL